ncbi:MAG: periplasmic heavy metal sensor [Betaproteobacteria bacterium]|nr:periplasmic heavy metal sensor [Betaproteobacteria bacterium]
MKAIIAFAVSIAIGLAPATAPAAENQPERSGASPGTMSGMTQGAAAEMMRGMPMMMRGMPMDARNEAPGLERPILSLALQNRTELGLSAEQEKTLREIVDRFGKEADRSRREIGTAERELAGLLKQEPGDPVQVESKVRAIEKLLADLRIARIQTIADGRAVLTPEQRAKLDLLAAERGRSGQGHGMRGAEEMQRFMHSERMPRAMSAMMAMAERMGGGDTMLGMVRMMEMMSMMGGGGMMGGGMMGDTQRPIRENK